MLSKLKQLNFESMIEGVEERPFSG
ncbi:hypothetical protein GQ600_2485 [Phytophthora cactorum]|nr:hypothetical protein GQ600_2485 [Phytophthora cactorum]